MSERPEGSALQRTLRWPVVRSALLVALVVGTILNLINQGDALFASAALHWPKLGLTYCVPFCVSLYGAFSALRLQGRP